MRTLPDILTRTRRGICPTCGAPLDLTGGQRDTTCAYCGGSSTLAYRLRHAEPQFEPPPGPEGTAKQHEQAMDWQPANDRHRACNCPGCGNMLDVSIAHAIQHCTHCGTDCKLESRLQPRTTADVQAPQERTEKDFQNQHRHRLEYPWDVETEQLIWRIIHEPDLDVRIALACNFKRWGYINHTAAHFLPWLLRHLQQDDDAVAAAASDVVGKLLCQGDATLILPVLQACQQVIDAVDGKRFILSELALGPGTCIKTLLDAAESASARGAHEFACHALLGVNMVFGRNFDDHTVMAEIVLYRMFDLHGPVLGWAMTMLRARFYLGTVVPHRTMLRAIDEFAHERPMVIAACRANMVQSLPETDDEFLERVSLLESLSTPAARGACAAILFWPPGHDEAHYARAVRVIEPLLDDPAHEWDAVQALCCFIDKAPHVPTAVTELIKARGEALPDRIKRHYLKRSPDTKLLDTSKTYYWQSDPDDAPCAEEQQFLDQYKDHLDTALDTHKTELRTLRQRIQATENVDAPVFLRDEPATIPIPDHLNVELIRQREEEKDLQRDEAFERYKNEYNERINALVTRVHDPDCPREELPELMSQITAMGEEFQKKMQELFGEGQD